MLNMVAYTFRFSIIMGLNLCCLFFLSLLIGDTIFESCAAVQIGILTSAILTYTYLVVRLSMKWNKDFNLTEILLILTNLVLLAGAVHCYFK